MKNIFIVLFVVAFVSCKQEVKNKKIETAPISETEISKNEKRESSKSNTEKSKSESSQTNVKKEPIIKQFKKRVFEEESDHKNLISYYVGDFSAAQFNENNPSYTNRINISINHIKDDSIYGHSVVAGNIRPFKGRFDPKTLYAEVSEPGDDKYDGVFEFTFYPKKKTLEGIWIANNENLAVPKREYNLQMKDFKYTPKLNLFFGLEEDDDDYNLALSRSQDQETGELEAISVKVIRELNASTQKLTNQDIENLNKGELEVLRNLIYARHGYSFKNRKMRYFFDYYIDWYIPVSTDIRNKLTALEKKNIDLIKRYEQHAERYYDYFGR
ncbi:YARHG domain-containing protein [Aquimarina algiphila]|uniref:YARHG domain-containing protein n=1 Tax=Aquimarina algiphila TaxID=2047982 RepID=UPI00232C5FC1|nr:YARHG domain-containing protein [Aquimarina algiphila]